MSKHYEEVTKYFNGKAELYDDVDDQIYWVLSDIYFQEILKREIPKYFKKGIALHLLDAGAGTGRWTMFFQKLFNKIFKIDGVLVDISGGMLNQAKNKLSKAGFSQFQCVEGNIEKMEKIKNNFFDIALSFYNVLSFVDNPSRAVKEIHKKLKKGGIHIALVANKYHALYFSILTNRVGEIDGVTERSKIRFNDLMPAIHCFTPGELENLYKKNGFKKVKVLGGPNFVYPGMEETFVKGNTSAIKDKLTKNSVFEKILKTELKFSNEKELVGRGNVLMVIAQK